MQEAGKFRFNTEELSERARRYAAKSRESLQVAQRLEDLFPQVLKTIKKSLSAKGARGDREALVHPDYVGKLDQYVSVLGDGLEARVQYETHRMMLQAMQSQNAYNRALQLSRGRNNPLK